MGGVKWLFEVTGQTAHFLWLLHLIGDFKVVTMAWCHLLLRSLIKTVSVKCLIWPVHGISLTLKYTIFPQIQSGSRIKPGLELNPGQLTYPI